jgi:hypothetical protein
VHYAGTRERWSSDARVGEMMLLSTERIAAGRRGGPVLGALAALGFERNTIVIFHADEGLRLLEHRQFGKGETLYEAELRVPLLMRWPNGKKKRGHPNRCPPFAPVFAARGISDRTQ